MGASPHLSWLVKSVYARLAPSSPNLRVFCRPTLDLCGVCSVLLSQRGSSNRMSEGQARGERADDQCQHDQAGYQVFCGTPSLQRCRQKRMFIESILSLSCSSHTVCPGSPEMFSKGKDTSMEPWSHREHFLYWVRNFPILGAKLPYVGGKWRETPARRARACGFAPASTATGSSACSISNVSGYGAGRVVVVDPTRHVLRLDSS